MGLCAYDDIKELAHLEAGFPKTLQTQRSSRSSVKVGPKKGLKTEAKGTARSIAESAGQTSPFKNTAATRNVTMVEDTAARRGDKKTRATCASQLVASAAAVRAAVTKEKNYVSSLDETEVEFDGEEGNSSYDSDGYSDDDDGVSGKHSVCHSFIVQGVEHAEDADEGRDEKDDTDEIGPEGIVEAQTPSRRLPLQKSSGVHATAAHFNNDHSSERHDLRLLTEKLDACLSPSALLELHAVCVASPGKQVNAISDVWLALRLSPEVINTAKDVFRQKMRREADSSLQAIKFFRLELEKENFY